jgi:ketosteroid isomerase-like protein
MHALAFTFALFFATAPASDPAAEVRRAETEFAAAFAARDKAKFASFIEDDATFFTGPNTFHGKEEVLKGWGKWLDDPQPPFSWKPENVVVTADGTLGESIGPVFLPNGTRSGRFNSIWRKQKDGSWKVLFDGPGAPVCPAAK